MGGDKLKQRALQYQAEVRCPVHDKLIGRFDIRTGLINATFYCPKCKFEYTFTIKPEKGLDSCGKVEL